MHRYLLCLLLAATSFSVACNSPHCFKTSVKKLYRKKLLSDGLEVIALNEYLLACPTVAESMHTPSTSTAYSAPLPEQLLFGIFSVNRQYEHCKDLFQQSTFQEAISQLPFPDQQAIAWYGERIKHQLLLLPLEEAESTPYDRLDDVQKKMINVFYHVKDWQFKPEKRSSGNYVLHGEYLPEQRVIMLYKTACKAGNIYEANIEKAALTHRYYFVGAHELGHAMDDLRNALHLATEKSRTQCEIQANIYGLVMTKAVARLFNARVQHYAKASAAMPPGSRMPCDSAFLAGTIQRWKDIELVLDKPLLKQVKMLGEGNLSVAGLQNDNWAAWGCMEAED